MSVIKNGDITVVATVLAKHDRNGQLALCAAALVEAERTRAANQEKQRQESLSQSAALRFEDGDKYDGSPADTGSI